MMNNNNLYGCYRNRKFTDIYPEVSVFIADYRASGLNTTELTDESLTLIYYELYAEYGNSTVASSDENQFKYALYKILINKGLVWQKSVEVQKKLRNLTDAQILQASRYLNNHAFNPGQGGESIIDGEKILDYINDQTSTKMETSYVNALGSYLTTLLDVSSAFIAEFKKLFLVIVNPELPLWYDDEEV